MRKRKWVDRQIDDALLTAATTAGVLYARRRATRALPKVIVGGAIVATVGGAAAAAAAGIAGMGVLGAGTAGAVWYRQSKKRSAAAEPWDQPAAPKKPSFVATDARSPSPAVAD